MVLVELMLEFLFIEDNDQSLYLNRGQKRILILDITFILKINELHCQFLEVKPKVEVGVSQ